MKLYQLIQPQNIFLQQAKTKKNTFLTDFVQQFAQNLNCSSEQTDQLLEEIYRREESISTGIGNEIGIPHARVDFFDQTVCAVATIPDGIKYEAIDRKPIKIAFLIFSPRSQAKAYMQIMAHLMRILKDEETRNRLIAAQTPQEFLTILQQEETEEIEETTQKTSYLLGLVLGKEKYEQEAINCFMELGILNAQTLESTALTKQMLHKIPLFSSFGLGLKKEIYSKIMLGFTENPADANKLFKLLKGYGYDIALPGYGAIFCLPLTAMIGGVPEDMDL